MKKTLFFLILLLIPSFLFPRSLEEIKKSGVLYVGFTQSWKNTINYIAAKEFAAFLGVEMVEVDILWDDIFAQNGKIPEGYQTNPKIAYTPDALKKADVIAGTIYITDWRKKFFTFSGISQISDLLIIKRNIKEKKGIDVKSYEDLKGLKIAFLENSSYETNLKRINDAIGGGIKFVKTSSEEQAYELLRNNEVDGLIAVSYLALGYIKNSKYYKLAFPVASPSNVGWAVENGNTGLQEEIKNFFETIRGNGKLDVLFRNKYDIDYSTYIEIINSYSNSKQTAETRDLDEIKESGKIVLALRDREMVYHQTGKKQFNHYLAEEFAKYLGVELQIVYTEAFSDYWEDSTGKIVLDSAYVPEWFNKFDVACDIIAPLDWRLKKVDIIDFMPNAKVVIGKKTTKINSINDLKTLKGVLSKGSSYEDALLANNISNFYYKQGNNFFSEVLNSSADYTISNVEVFDLADYQELEAKFILGTISKMGWAIKKNQPKLRQKILEFIEFAKKEGILDYYFKQQTGMTLKAAENYLTVLHESYQEGNFPFVFYGAEQGLPQEDILSIFQDAQGYIWFGTYSGAVKYNGRTMKVFGTKQGMINNAIYGIAQDKKGTMFFATLNGISILEQKSDTLRSVFSGTSFRDIYIDDQNTKWFYGDKGIYKLTDKNKGTFFNELLKGLPDKVHSISQDPKREYTAIAASSGLYILSGSNSNILTKISDQHCHYAMFDSDGQLWTSTRTGLYIADKNALKDKLLGREISTIINISNKTVRKITQTDDGSIWLTTDYEVFQILTLKQKPIVYNDNIGLKRYRVLSFMLDNEDNLWFGFSGGIQKLTNKSLRTLFPEHLNSFVNAVVEDKENRIWFGINNDIYYLKDELYRFTDRLDTKSKSFVISKLPNANIIIANTEAIYEIDVKTLNIVKERKFETNLFHLEDIFISEKIGIFLLTGVNGIIYFLENINSDIVTIENHATRLIYNLEEIDGEVLGANSTGIVKFKAGSFWKLKDTGESVWSMSKGTITNSANGEEKTVLWVGTERGLGIYEKEKFYIIKCKDLENTVINAIKPDLNKNKLWLGTDRGVMYYDIVENVVDFTVDSRDGLLGNEIAIDGLYLDGRGILWISTYHGVATFDIKKRKLGKMDPVCRIESIKINDKTYYEIPKILKHNENNLTFEISGLSFKDEKSVEYEFYLQGLENDYAANKGNENIAKYQNLPPGKYSFKYRAKGRDGIWCYYQSVQFEILKPFYLELWFISALALVAVLFIYMIIKWRVRILKKRNEQLEETVKERTAEILEKNAELEASKEEIEAAKDEIEAQRDAATKARDEIASRKSEIDSSILYAKRIQNAILPPQKFIKEKMPDNFILFKPRDIVSGDYYWAAPLGNKIYFAAADCTGHGVPGAFMSMLGISFLNGIIGNATDDITAADILNLLRNKIIGALHQTGEVHEAKDGMDIALCVVDRENMKLQFSGAFNPLYIVRDEELMEFGADRMPIGIYEYEGDKHPFTNTVIDIQTGDLLYVFSDGYADQFGGKRGKKFMTGRFKKLLVQIRTLSMEKQHDYLDRTIETWREGVSEQIDDILVIGVKI